MSEITDLQKDTYNDLLQEPYAYLGILRKKTFGTYNPTTGRNEITEADHNCVIVFKKLAGNKSIPKYYEIRDGDKMCLVAANGIEPRTKDQLIINSVTYEIKYCQDTSAGTNALFEAVIR